MDRSPEIRINPELLIWAREDAGIDIASVAKRLGVKEELVNKWEEGDTPVSYLRLESLADYYQRPVAAFFLPTVPHGSHVPTDFRATTKANLEVTRTMRRAIRHARLIRNSFSEIAPEYKKFVRPKISLSDDVEKIAERERRFIGVDIETQHKWHAQRETYNNWVRVLEDAGILVLQVSFPTDELSGFSLKDGDKPPVIVVNSGDVFPRKIFTLFHEYCHLILDTEGICVIKSTSSQLMRDKSVESFCDKFASAFLVPPKHLLSRKDLVLVKDEKEGDKVIRRIANFYKVSRQAILLRLLLANKISRKFYDEKKRVFDTEFEIFLAKKKQRERESEGGPPPYMLALSQNGRLFSRTALKAYREGAISKKGIASYLGVKLSHIPHIEAML